MRKVINKNISEKDMMKTAYEVFLSWLEEDETLFHDWSSYRRG
jgi:hypothetical protein